MKFQIGWCNEKGESLITYSGDLQSIEDYITVPISPENIDILALTPTRICNPEHFAKIQREATRSAIKTITFRFHPQETRLTLLGRIKKAMSIIRYGV